MTHPISCVAGRIGHVLAAVGLSAAVALSVTGAGPGAVGVAMAAAQPASSPTDGGLTLSYQTPWVGASGDFSLRLHVDRPPGRSDPEVAVTIYPAVATRSEFAQTIGDKIAPAPLFPVQTLPMSSLVPDAAGDVTLNLHLADRLSLGKEDGVFPVRVALRERTTERVLQQFTTHLVYLPGQHTGAKLGMALVLPVHASAGLPPTGGRRLQDIDDLAALSSSLDATGSTPLTLAPTPETLATLAASTDDKAVTALKGLQQRAPTAPPACPPSSPAAWATTSPPRSSEGPTPSPTRCTCAPTLTPGSPRAPSTTRPSPRWASVGSTGSSPATPTSSPTQARNSPSPSPSSSPAASVSCRPW